MPGAPLVAQTYPAREVKLVVPFPTGGVTDLNARILAKHLTKYWGQPVSVVNMPGEGGTKGTMFVLAAPADGYTMMMSATVTTKPTLGKNFARIFPIEALRPVAPSMEVTMKER